MRITHETSFDEDSDAEGHGLDILGDQPGRLTSTVALDTGVRKTGKRQPPPCSCMLCAGAEWPGAATGAPAPHTGEEPPQAPTRARALVPGRRPTQRPSRPMSLVMMGLGDVGSVGLVEGEAVPQVPRGGAAPCLVGTEGTGAGRQARKLDTSTKCVRTVRNYKQNIDISPSEASIFDLVAGGQTVFASETAQFGFDGVAYAVGKCAESPPVPLGTDDDPFPPPASRSELRKLGIKRSIRNQNSFAFEAGGGVQMTFEEWQKEAAEAMRWFGSENSKRATRIASCGSLVMVPRCEDCGNFEVDNQRRSADCEVRVCPNCARDRARPVRAKLRRAMDHWSLKGRGKTWFMHVITIPRPRGTSIQRLSRHERLAWDVIRNLVSFLKQECGSTRSFASLEVSPGGVVHVNLLAHHSFVRGKKFEQMRRAATELQGASQYKVQRIKGGKKGAAKAAAEVAKYITKGVAGKEGSKQTHPLLSAMVDVALRGRKLQRWYGNWKGLPDAEDLEQEWKCSLCEGPLRYAYMTPEDAEAIRAAQHQSSLLQQNGPAVAGAG